MNRGCRVASRLANFYPTRFIAFAFFAVGYTPPNAALSWTQANEMIKGMLKRDITGYQAWFSSNETAKILENNVRPIDILFYSPWLTHRYVVHSSTRSSAFSSLPTRKYG